MDKVDCSLSLWERVRVRVLACASKVFEEMKLDSPVRRVELREMCSLSLLSFAPHPSPLPEGEGVGAAETVI